MSPEEQILALVRQHCTGDPEKYVHEIVKPYALERLNNAIASCKACPIYCHGIKTMFHGTGNEPVMMIGSAPIRQQHRQGSCMQPFYGTEEKKILDILIAHYQVDPAKLCWMNLVNCYPAMAEQNDALPDTRPLKSSEIAACSKYLEAAVRIVRPKFLILFGNEVLNHFNIVTIKKAHGTQMEFMGIPCMPVPSVSRVVRIMHDPDMLPEDVELKKLEFQNDLGKAFAAAHQMFPDENIIKH